MLTASFTEFRNSATMYIDKVSKGETVRILRHGKLVAVVSPAGAENKEHQEYWKSRKPFLKVKGGKSATEIFMESRGAERF